VSTELDEMWAAFEAHKPDASYADAWATMLKERTRLAARAVYDATPVGSAARAAALSAAGAAAALSAAGAAATAAAGAAAWADRYAQDAIDAIKGEQS
jgi:hypothetical protein